MKLQHSYFYHPDYVESNMEIVQHFENQGISMQKIQNSLGRSNIFVATKDSKETTLSMAIEAANGVLKESNISIQEINIIVFVSSTPEHTLPCDSINIHQALNAKPSTLCYDINVNCIGGFVALDQVSKYLTVSNSAQKALVICAEQLSSIADYNNPMTAFSFSDSGFAFIVEKDDSDSGLIDVLYHTDSSLSGSIVFPPNGYSSYHPDDVTIWDNAFNGSGSVNFALDNMNQFLERNHLKLEDIDLFLFSQFSLKNVQIIRKKLNLTEEMTPFYSPDLGYTGASSPFLALDQYQRNVRRLQEGENILIWTLGSGYQAGLMLWRY